MLLPDFGKNNLSVCSIVSLAHLPVSRQSKESVLGMIHTIIPRTDLSRGSQKKLISNFSVKNRLAVIRILVRTHSLFVVQMGASGITCISRGSDNTALPNHLSNLNVDATQMTIAVTDTSLHVL